MVPAFLGLVPPTTLVPARVSRVRVLCSASASRTVVNGLLGVEAVARVSSVITLVGRGPWRRSAALRTGDNVRPLLPGEALVDDLGVGVDAQVVDGGGVLRAARAVAPGLAEDLGGRPSSRKGLHLGRFEGDVEEKVG